MDFDTLKKDYQPITGPLTLAEAIARALKYNYDAELTRVEQTLQERQIDIAMAQMLPRLAASAGNISSYCRHSLPSEFFQSIFALMP